MRAICVIQARLSSQRLHGKILMPLRGRPSLEYLTDGIRHAQRLDGVVIATSTHVSDDATAEFAEERGINCHRGSLEHVAQRMLNAGEEYEAQAIVRISGDSPLLDPALVDQAIELYREAMCDVVTNVRPRSFPKGQSVEVISLAALRMAVGQMTAAADREHVTPFIYAHADQFSIRSFVADAPRPEVQLSIDTAADFDRCAAILGLLPGSPWQVGWRACVAAYDQVVAVQGANVPVRHQSEQ
jgi:spore coat polysaccharide biosynthesis protein SpsF